MPTQDRNALKKKARAQLGTVGSGNHYVDVFADEAGIIYWHLMGLAGAYAYSGREWVARKVVSILGAREMELVHNHHNFAWREIHDGRDLVVVRKRRARTNSIRTGTDLPPRLEFATAITLR